MKVKELLDSPEKWTKGTQARNSLGETVDYSNPEAVCWCLTGAVRLCYMEESQIYSDVYRRIRIHLNLLTSSPIFGWNDAPERTFEDVRKLVEELDI